MQKHTFRFVILIFAIELFCDFGVTTFAQINKKESIESVKFSDSSKKIVDLTNAAETRCTESLQRDVGKNSVVLKFQPEFRKEAEQIMERLASAIRQTQEILYPLQIRDIKFYLLQVDEMPTNYRMRATYEEKKFYLQLFAFKKKEDLSLDSCSDVGLCDDIFGTVPHESTHAALDDFITRRNTRWFDDGLATFVGNSVYEKLSQINFIKYRGSVSPSVSLHRKDIRESILRWHEQGMGIFKSTQSELLNEFYRYSAAYELIRLIIETAKKKGIENPLGILLTKLKEQREKSGKPASTEDLISIIQQNLKVDPRTLGVLDTQTQKTLADEAISLLSKDNLTFEQKNYALYVLAGIDEMNLSDRWINYLLDQVYQQKPADNEQRDIAATALVVRFNQAGFDELLRTYLAGDARLKGKSIKKIKSELAEFSLRPRPD